MKERIVDTNVILRYITEDLPKQASQCEKLFRRVLNEEEIIEIPLLVIAEVLWTLTKFYKQPKKDVVENISIMLKTPNIRVKDKNMILDALELYRDKNLSFTDAYLAIYSIKSNRGIYSFDEDFDKIGVDRETP